MKIHQQAPSMTGSIEDMIAQLAIGLEEQASAARDAARAAQEARQHAAESELGKRRDSQVVRLVSGVGASVVTALGVATDNSEAAGPVAALGSTLGEGVSSMLETSAVVDRDRANSYGAANEQYREQRDVARAYADKALGHLSEVQQLTHDSAMIAVRV